LKIVKGQSMFRRTMNLGVVLLVSASGLAQEKASPVVPAGVIYEKDIEFGRGGETPLLLDLARPENATKPLPCIVVVHGGG
jgi:acetyl esterase/lipase